MKVCAGRKKNVAALDSQKVSTAAKAARGIASPALLAQEKLLETNPGVDYVIVLPTGSQDVGVQLSNPMGQLMFRAMRQKAPTSPYAVYRMYEFLVSTHEHVKDILRKQLQAEYGVDPLSDEAMNAPRDNITEDEIATITSQSGMDVGSLLAELPSVSKPSRALQLQNAVLKQNPVLDYVVFGPEGQMDRGIEWQDRDDKLGFRIARLLAEESVGYVGTMYNKIVASHPDLKEFARKQLLDEYGVDPASEAVQNAPRPEAEDTEASSRKIQAGWPTPQQIREKSIFSKK